MNFKKISIKTEETYITKTTQTMELDFDFTQVYDCMYSLSFSLRSPVSFQLLFFILKSVSNDNMIAVNSHLYATFNKEKKEHGFGTISEQTFYSCIKELNTAKIITKMSKGQYFINPYVLWKDDKTKRIDFLKEENKSPNGKAYNPKENLNYLNEEDIEYRRIE